MHSHFLPIQTIRWKVLVAESFTIPIATYCVYQSHVGNPAFHITYRLHITTLKWYCEFRKVKYSYYFSAARLITFEIFKVRHSMWRWVYYFRLRYKTSSIQEEAGELGCLSRPNGVNRYHFGKQVTYVIITLISIIFNRSTYSVNQ
jgi:hypothetical protein